MIVSRSLGTVAFLAAIGMLLAGGIALVLMALAPPAYAQGDTLRLSLDEAVARAQSSGEEARIANAQVLRAGGQVKEAMACSRAAELRLAGLRLPEHRHRRAGERPFKRVANCQYLAASRRQAFKRHSDRKRISGMRLPCVAVIDIAYQQQRRLEVVQPWPLQDLRQQLRHGRDDERSLLQEIRPGALARKRRERQSRQAAVGRNDHDRGLPHKPVERQPNALPQISAGILSLPRRATCPPPGCDQFTDFGCRPEIQADDGRIAANHEGS